MSPIIRLVRNDISPDVRRYAREMKKGLRDVVKQTAKGITRRVIDLTPPASEGTTGAAARRQGQVKIERQMHSILAPKKLKGRRKITHVFGNKLRRPVYVPTKEKYPDVAGLYRANSKASGTGVGIAAKKRRQKFYVDVRKFKAELKRRQARVGALAAGWAAAAAALDVPLQVWIKRHGASGGTIRIDTAGERMHISVENLAPGVPGNVRGELARRIPYAVEYERAAMVRAIDGYHQRLSRRGARLAA